MSGTISLDTRCAQTAKTKLVVRLLPGIEFIDGQRVAPAHFLERKQTTANRDNNLGFTTRHPTFCSRWWQIGDRQWRTVRPNHVVAWWARRLSHGRRYRSIQSALGRYAGPRKAPSTVPLAVNGSTQCWGRPQRSALFRWLTGELATSDLCTRGLRFHANPNSIAGYLCRQNIQLSDKTYQFLALMLATCGALTYQGC